MQFDNNRATRQGDDAEYRMPPDETMPTEEHIPREECWSTDEFNENCRARAEEAKESSHDRLRQMLLKPVVGVGLAASVFLASFGLDLLSDAAPALDLFPDQSAILETQTPAPTQTPETSPETVLPTETEEPTEAILEDDDFPELDNLDPDFAGDYAWSGEGSEEYICFRANDKEGTVYLVKGSVWDQLDPDGELVSALDGAVYDRDTNTLTLTDCTADVLDVNLMGNGFTIALVGDNHLSGIQVWGAGYGGSLKFVGDGKLTVTNGLLLQSEGSGSCLMVGHGVTLDLSGPQFAVAVLDSTMSPAVYISRYLTVSGGESQVVGMEEQGDRVFYTEAFISPEGEPATHILIAPNT